MITPPSVSLPSIFSVTMVGVNHINSDQKSTLLEKKWEFKYNLNNIFI